MAGSVGVGKRGREMGDAAATQLSFVNRMIHKLIQRRGRDLALFVPPTTLTGFPTGKTTSNEEKGCGRGIRPGPYNLTAEPNDASLLEHPLKFLAGP